MKCLYCGKEISENASSEEKSWQWHRKCIRHFFGTENLPAIDLTEDSLKELVNETVNKGLTVPGVQKKLSLHLTYGTNARLTLVNYPTGYILKPQSDDYESLPESEHMAMQMAEAAGIQTVPHALIHVGGNYAYITRRIDRKITRDSVRLYAMEDFCQLSGRLTEDKYRGSYEGCGRIISKYSSYPGFDLTELFLRILVSFVIGNSDMHLKNFSLIEEKPHSRIFRLSAAYDFLPVNVILPEDQEEMALTVNGKKKNIHRKDFMALAKNCDIPEKAAERMIQQVISCDDRFISICQNSFLSENQKQQVIQLIQKRIERLKKHKSSEQNGLLHPTY